MRTSLTLILTLATLVFAAACGQPQHVQRQCGVFHDLNGRPYNVDCNTGHAYYLDQQGQITTVVVPANAVPTANGQPVYVDPNRAVPQTQQGSNSTIQTPNTAPVDTTRRTSTVPQARQQQPQAAPAAQPVQPRVSTVPQARTQPAPQARPAPAPARTSTVPARTSTVPTKKP